MADTKRPTTCQANLAKLPRALAPLIERPQWCVWRWTQLPNGKWQKPPYMATQPIRHASTKDSTTWADYATALAAVQAGHGDGLTYILTEADPFAAIDLDNCRHVETSSIDIWAQNYLEAARNSYSEVTPSGSGVRIWGLADGAALNRKFTLNIDGKDIAAELFRHTNKALTVTGYKLDSIRELTNIDKVFDWAVVWGERRKTAAPALKNGNGFNGDGGGCGYSIDEIEQIVRAGAPDGANRSNLFHTIVGHYVGCGWDAEQIIEHLVQFPDGIGARYIGENRLAKEVTRSAVKYGAAPAAAPTARPARRPTAAVPRPEAGPKPRNDPELPRAAAADSGSASSGPAPDESKPPPARQPPPVQPDDYDPEVDDVDPDADDDDDEIDEEPPEQKAAVVPVDLWEKYEAPPLPIELLPMELRTYVSAQARLMGCDPAGLAMGALTVCGAAIPDGIQVQVKKHDKGWKESARLWVALEGPPSTMKSPSMRRVTDPINVIEADLSRAYANAKAIYDALSAEDRRTTPPPPKLHIRIEDTSPEAAQSILRDSPNGVLLIRDELAGWFGAMDKYSGHRGASMDRAFWLQAFTGGSYSFDRVSRGSGFVSNMSVSILGGIQEDTLRKIIGDGVDDGLIQRLFVVMLRPAKLGTDEPAPLAADQYSDLVNRLHNMVPDPAPRQFTDDAQIIRRQLEQQHLDLMTAYERLNKKLAAHIGKYNGLFARLCLIWHCIEHGDEPYINADTAQRVATFLQDFLLPHAESFYAGSFSDFPITTTGSWLSPDTSWRTSASSSRPARSSAATAPCGNWNGTTSKACSCNWTRWGGLSTRRSNGSKAPSNGR